MNGLRSKRKAETAREFINSSRPQTPSRPKPAKEQKLDQSWDDISDDFFSAVAESSESNVSSLTPTKNKNVKQTATTVRSPFKRGISYCYISYVS